MMKAEVLVKLRSNANSLLFLLQRFGASRLLSEQMSSLLPLPVCAIGKPGAKAVDGKGVNLRDAGFPLPEEKSDLLDG